LMAFSGTTDILGDVVNDTGGQIVTSGGATTTIFDDLEHNGAEIRTSSDSRTVIFGQASGAGPYTGDGTVYFEGDLRPGSSPGQVGFGGNVVLGSGSTTVIELGGTVRGDEYDAIIVDGDFTLDGSLNVLKIGGYVPQAGDQFDILDFEPAKLSGLFSTVSLPTLASGLDWDQTNLYTTGELLVSLATSQISGDFNSDGVVDAADYTLWQDNLGLDASALNGNGSGAATVVRADYQMWKINFGQSTASGSGADHIPEPTTLLLTLLALAAVPLRVRHG